MPPRIKTLPKLTPDILKRLIPEALMMKYNGMVYDERRPCPRCFCEESMRNDRKGKTFCTVITDDGFRDVRVGIKRFKCKRCGFVFEGRAPFYDGCAYGAPIVDLCLALAASNPYNRVESIMMQYGIQVDRDTVKNYAKRFRDRAVKSAGIPVMDDATIGVNVLRILFGVDNVEELKRSYPQGKYDGLMDETYPRVKGAKKALSEERYAKKSSGERQPRFPRSFTLVSSYLSNVRCFASISCRNAPFNSIVADTVARPLRGCDAIITDGSECYDDIRSYRCLFHKMRNFFAIDPFLQRARREKEKSLLPPWVLSQHMRELYSFAEEEYLQWLKERHPNLVDHDTGQFIGATTTNAMEGGNHRLKYELRADYINDESAEARCLLIAIKDSTKTFRHGRPEQSFAAMNSGFEYGMLMGAAMNGGTERTIPMMTTAA